MELGKAWEYYKEHNIIFSNQAKFLAITIAAICWFFRIENKTSECTEIKFPALISIALFFIVLFFLFGLTQHLSQTLKWRYTIKKEEKKLTDEGKELTEDTEISITDSIDQPALTLLYLKTIVLYIAGLLLLAHFINILTL